MNKSKNTERNIIQVDLIKSRLVDLKNEIEEMSEDEKEIEKPDDIINLVEKILDLNNRNQEKQGLNILTPDQMFGRLPITLVQLQARNNLEKT